MTSTVTPRPSRGRRARVGITLLATAALVATSAPVDAAALAESASQAAAGKGARAVFHEDFSGDTIDRSKWTVEVTGVNFGTVNNEQQAYVDSAETMYIDHDDAGTGAGNGALALHPRYRPGFHAPDGRTYDFISGRLNTAGKVSFTYGSMSARMKLPAGAGFWPAFWALGENIGSVGWPECGEIDVMENVGDPTWTNAALHGPGYSGNTPLVQRQYFSGSSVEDWHVYRADWNAGGFAFFVDDREYYRVSRAQVERYGRWVYNAPQFVILNFALGGVYPNAVNGVTQPYFGIPQSTVDIVARDGARTLIDWVEIRTPARPQLTIHK